MGHALSEVKTVDRRLVLCGDTILPFVFSRLHRGMKMVLYGTFYGGAINSSWYSFIVVILSGELINLKFEINNLSICRCTRIADVIADSAKETNESR